MVRCPTGTPGGTQSMCQDRGTHQAVRPCCPVPAIAREVIHGTSDYRRMYKLRYLRASLPERGYSTGDHCLRDNPGTVHRVRWPLRHPPVPECLSRTLHYQRSRARGDTTATAGPLPAYYRQSMKEAAQPTRLIPWNFPPLS